MWVRIFLVLVCLGTGCSGGSTSSSSSCTVAQFSRAATAGKEIIINRTDFGGTTVAQPFVVTSSQPVKGVSLSLKGNGSFPSNTYFVSATIEADSGSSAPNGTPIVSSSRLDVSTVSTQEAGVYSLPFSSNASLNLSQIYWLRVKVTYPASATDYIAWQGTESSADTYQASGTTLNAKYETSTGNFATSLIGAARFLIFSIGC